MELKVDVETVDPTRRRVVVEVPAAAVSAELEKAFQDLARAAKVPGFRQGRVPRPVIERLFGDRVRADVFGRLIHETYSEAVDGQQLPVVGRPEITTEQAEPGGALRYSATVEVRPDVVPRHYTGVEVERPVISVGESDVDAAIEHLRQTHAQLVPISDRADVQRGDVVTLDYEGRLDGRIAGRAENRDVEIGANGFPPEFDERLLGATLRAELDFTAAYAAEHANSQLAGKTVQFHVRVRGLSRKELPALDDDFAKDHGDAATLSELRARARTRLEGDAARQADDAVRRAVLAQVAERNDIPIPTALVERRREALVEDVWHDWSRQRVRPKNQADVLARLRAELEPRAREQVKVSLLLDAVARQENLRVSDSDVEARIQQLATDAGAAAERVRALYQDAAARQRLAASMLEARAVEFMVARARVRAAPRAMQIADAAENG